MPASWQASVTLRSSWARRMTRRRIVSMLSSRVIPFSSHSRSLGGVQTLGRIGRMALFSFHRCQHYYESGHPSERTPKVEAIRTDAAWGLSTMLSQAVRVGDLLFVSGQVPRYPNGELVTGNFEAEVRRTLDNIK